MAGAFHYNARMNYYQDKRVWITGASSGLGKALSLQIARSGGRVVVTARNIPALENLSAEGTAGGEIRILPGDMEDPESLSALAKEAWDSFGGLDMIILNAGISQRSVFTGTSAEVGKRILAIDFLSQIEIVRYVLPRMEEQGSGHIVSVSSLAGKIASPLRAYYAAAKHALQGFFGALRVETAGSGVRVSLVVPGFVNTDISKHALSGDGKAWKRSDRNQLSGPDPERAARRIMKGLAAGKREILIGYPPRAVIALVLGTRFPGIFDRVLSKTTYT